jgi:hypothetical protein
LQTLALAMSSRLGLRHVKTTYFGFSKNWNFEDLFGFGYLNFPFKKTKFFWGFGGETSNSLGLVFTQKTDQF